METFQSITLKSFILKKNKNIRMKLSKVILSTIAAQGIVSFDPFLTPFDPSMTVWLPMTTNLYIRKTVSFMLRPKIDQSQRYILH